MNSISDKRLISHRISSLWNENSRAFLFHKENMVTETKIWYGNIKTMENTESRS